MSTNVSPYGDRPMFDEEGFLVDASLWSESLAAAIARQDGLSELTADHWQVIRSLREHYERFGVAPPAFQHICIASHLGKHCMEDLFHGPREAWRVAGLPQPGEETKAYI